MVLNMVELETFSNDECSRTWNINIIAGQLCAGALHKGGCDVSQNHSCSNSIPLYIVFIRDMLQINLVYVILSLFNIFRVTVEARWFAKETVNFT